MLERLFKSPEVDALRLAALMRRLAPDSPVIQEVAQVLAPVLEQQQQLALGPGGAAPGMPGLQPGLQEASAFAPGALGAAPPGGAGQIPYVGGRPAGAGTALPTGPNLGV